MTWFTACSPLPDLAAAMSPSLITHTTWRSGAASTPVGVKGRQEVQGKGTR